MENFDFSDFFQATELSRDENLLPYIFGDLHENFFCRFTTRKKNDQNSKLLAHIIKQMSVLSLRKNASLK